MTNPAIEECRKLIKRLPKGYLQERYPYFNENQVINLWITGDIMQSPEEFGHILSEYPYLPTSMLTGQQPVRNQPQVNQPQVNQPQVQVEPAVVLPPEQLGLNPFGALRRNVSQQPPINPAPPRPNLPRQAATGRSERGASLPAGTGASGGATKETTDTGRPLDPAKSSADFKKYNLQNVRPELRAAAFVDASKLRDLNPDEKEHFRRAYYLKHGGEIHQDNEGRASRNNPTGSRTWYGKTKKEPPDKGN